MELDRSTSRILNPEFILENLQRVREGPKDEFLRNVARCVRGATYGLKGTPRRPKIESSRAREIRIMIADAVAAETQNWRLRCQRKGLETGPVFNDPESSLSVEVDVINKYNEKEVGILFFRFPEYFRFKEMDQNGISMSPEERKYLLLSTAIMAANGLQVVHAVIWHIAFLGGNHHTFGRIIRGVVTMNPKETREAKDLYFDWLSTEDIFKRDNRRLPFPSASSRDICKTCLYSNTCREGRQITQTPVIGITDNPGEPCPIEQRVIEGLEERQPAYKLYDNG